jgi:hypothetical protein
MSKSDRPLAMVAQNWLDPGNSEDRLSTISSGPDDAFFPLSAWVCAGWGIVTGIWSSNKHFLGGGFPFPDLTSGLASEGSDEGKTIRLAYRSCFYGVKVPPTLFGPAYAGAGPRDFVCCGRESSQIRQSLTMVGNIHKMYFGQRDRESGHLCFEKPLSPDSSNYGQ